MTHTLAVPLLARVTGLCCRTEGKVPGQGGQTQGHAEPPEQSVQLHPPPPPPWVCWRLQGQATMGTGPRAWAAGERRGQCPLGRRQ